MKVDKKLLLFVCLLYGFLISGIISKSYGAENYGEQAKNVLGYWQQFVNTDGKWRALGVFLVDKKQGIYLMAPVDQIKDKKIINSRGLFDVGFNSDEWHFKSDWGQGNIGEFKLKQISSGVYIGWSYFNGEKMQKNLWLRIK